MEVKISNRKEAYEHICNDYVQTFAKKQELDFDGWVGNDIGGLALFSCAELHFNLSDIVFDINTNQPKGKIIDWYYGYLENEKKMNYKSYCNGLKFEKL